MSKYRQFEILLEGFLDEKLKRSYIEDVLSEGYNYIMLAINDDGSLSIYFDGNYRYQRHFNSLNHFKQRSEILDDLEGVTYVLVTSCANAEKLSKSGIPSDYSVKVIIDDADIFEYHVEI